MTGFGAAEEGALAVEIRTVNHRYLDPHLRLPRECAIFEPEVRALVARHLRRGRVELSARLGGIGSNGIFRVDREQAEKYLDAVRHLHMEGSPHTVDLAALLALPGVLVPEVLQQDPEVLKPMLLGAVERACVQLSAMRREEGAALEAELRERLAAITQATARLRERAPQSAQAAGQRLRERVAGLAGEVGVDAIRIAQEAAILAERADVTEELIRLASHLEQFATALDSDEPAGRTLDFLLVEMNREANTTGAKCQDAEMSREVVFVKGEIEKLREQVQNVE
ncbi:MAG: YicC family protein [Nitrospirota bacterium]|nr:YicC family protein [Nitrospirota bacterium]